MPLHHKSIQHVGKKGYKVAKEVLKKRTEKLTVVEARKQLQNRKDNTDENVKKLLLLSSANIGRPENGKVKIVQLNRLFSNDSANSFSSVRMIDFVFLFQFQLIKRAQTGRYVVKAKNLVQKRAKEDNKESVFSEEDFSKFEEELQRLG